MTGWREGAAAWSAVIALALLAAVAGFAAAKPPKWMAVRTPHFTVLTTGAPAAAAAWATDLERFRVGLGEIMPANAARLAPVVMIIFPNEKAFHPYKMLQNGQPAQVGGFFARVDEVNAIGLAQDTKPAETRRIIFHEATHWFMNARDEVPPAWFEEGIAEVFSTYTADARQFTIGDLVPDHVRSLRKTGVPALAELVTMPREKLDYSDPTRTGKFYAGAWLFVHWAMFGQKSAGSDGLRRYLEAVRAGRTGEAAFRAGFAGDYAAVGAQLRQYAAKGEFTRRTYPLPAVEAMIGPPTPATEAEIEYALGALLLGGRGPGEALPHLQRAAELEPAQPRGWEALGTAYLHSERTEEAFAALDRAIKAGSRSGVVWNNRAALREKLQHLEEGALVLDGAVFADSAADFRQAIALDPQCQAAYEGLGGVVYAVVPYDAGDVVRLEQGRRWFPEDRWIQVGLASARLRSAKPGDAKEELRGLLQDGALEDRVRRLAQNALENEILNEVNRDIEGYNRDRRFAELTARLDAVLRDPVISPATQESLRKMRTQADQFRRIDEAVSAYNHGRAKEAVAVLRTLRDEPPATDELRGEVMRLLQQMDPGGSRGR